jgi:opacity protein-like surface antigen
LIKNKEKIMNKIQMSIVALLSLSTITFAGGLKSEIMQPPVEPIEVEEAQPSPFYIGGGYSYVEGSDENSDPSTAGYRYEMDADGIMFQAGYKINPYIAIEGRYTMANGADVDVRYLTGASRSADITNIAIYAKPTYPIGRVNIYGLLGYGKTEVDYSSITMEDWDKSGFQWGGGANFEITSHFAVFADYTRWCDFDEASGMFATTREMDAITVGLTYTF